MCPVESGGWAEIMDTPAKRLHWAIFDLRGLDSAAEAARLTGVRESTMRAYLVGNRNPPLEQCEIIGAGLRVNPRWLHSGAPNTPDVQVNEPSQTVLNVSRLEKVPLTGNPRRLTLYSSALAGPMGEFMLSSEQAGTVASPPSLDLVDEAYAVHIVGDSMSPRYEAGEIVFIHPFKPVRRGDYVVVQLWQDEHAPSGAVMGMVKRLVALSDKEVVLAQLNPPQEFSVLRKRVKSVHRVVGSSEG